MDDLPPELEDKIFVGLADDKVSIAQLQRVNKRFAANPCLWRMLLMRSCPGYIPPVECDLATMKAFVLHKRIPRTKVLDDFLLYSRHASFAWSSRFIMQFLIAVGTIFMLLAGKDACILCVRTWHVQAIVQPSDPGTRTHGSQGDLDAAVEVVVAQRL